MNNPVSKRNGMGFNKHPWEQPRLNHKRKYKRKPRW
jgi:hypothetical protein